MEGSTIRTIAEYIVELHRRDRNRNGTDQHSPEYPETEFDTNGVQRDQSGDERCNQNPIRQSWDNI